MTCLFSSRNHVTRQGDFLCFPFTTKNFRILYILHHNSVAMAETLGFGASILAFIAVADKLSSATATQYPSISDAPSVARGVRTQLGELGMILFHIDHTRSKSPECVGDPAVESYWTGKQAKLRSDFARFENFAAQLAENTGKARIKKKWSLSLEGRLKKVQYLLAKDIEVLRALLEIMESLVSVSLIFTQPRP